MNREKDTKQHAYVWMNRDAVLEIKAMAERCGNPDIVEDMDEILNKHMQSGTVRYLTEDELKDGEILADHITVGASIKDAEIVYDSAELMTDGVEFYYMPYGNKDGFKVYLDWDDDNVPRFYQIMSEGGGD